ncbi:MAG: STAS/SEC14 domain-containing protein [Anaerolineae bacterium]|nr:STAS/SEC14 domain-containing protein [Anaerolineae bacterium]
MAYKVYMDDNDILRLLIMGNFLKEDVDLYFKEIIVFKNKMQGNPLRMLVDAREVEKVDAAARRTMMEFLQSSHFVRVAVLGKSRYVRVLVKLVNKVIGQENVRFCSSEAEALAWLEEK